MFLHFEAKLVEPVSKREKIVLVLFKALGIANPDELMAAFKDIGAQYLQPDYTLVVVPPFESEDTHAQLTNPTIIKEFSRIAGATGGSLASWDVTGKVAITHILFGSAMGDEAEELLAQIYEQGARHLAKTNQFIDVAPPGCVFQKPSEKSSKYFIRASRLLWKGETLTFLCAQFLQYLSKQKISNVQRIWVDTPAIAVLIHTVLLIQQKLGALRTIPMVSSFNSYQGVETEKFEVETSSVGIVVISASTSGGLANKISQRGVQGDVRLLTLVAPKPEEGGDHQVLIELDLSAIKIAHGIVEDEDADLDPLSGKVIAISSEEFAFQDGPLRAVALTKDHCRGPLRETIQKAIGRGWFKIRAQASDVHNKPRHILVDPNRLLADQDFQKWVDDVVRSELPISVGAIAHDGVDASRILAQQIKAKISEVAGLNIPILESLDEKAISVLQSRYLVMVAATVGSGDLILQKSRELRAVAPDKKVVYLCGALVPPSWAELRTLRSNLETRSGASKNRFIFYSALPIGADKEGRAWLDEAGVLARTIAHCINAGDEIEALESRLDSIQRSTQGLTGDLFWSAHGGDQQQKITPNFVFWDDDVSAEHLSKGSDLNADVYVTIALVLQNARENYDRKLSEQHVLRDGVGRFVVLDPENFHRYSDGVIQSALLRAAYPRELDYRRSDELSAKMAWVIEGVVSFPQSRRGESAVEFVIAYVSKRIQLSKPHKLILEAKLAGLSTSKQVPAVVRSMLKTYFTQAPETPPF